MKNFDQWNIAKKHIHENKHVVYAHPREIWWCALGLNVGAEIDGKNDTFERPVLVMRVYNLETLLVLPLTSKPRSDTFHAEVKMDDRTTWVKLTQTRVISSKRLIRKVGVLPEEMFLGVVRLWKAQL